MEAYINMVLLTLLAIVTLTIVRQRNLFSVVVLFGVYSFLMASVMIVLDAVDVALTEAAVGAGISTVVLIGTLHITGSEEMRPSRLALLPIVTAAATGAILIWGTYDLPEFGKADVPINTHVAPFYLEQSIPLMGVPNVVTTILANFRSFDTLGETTVIFTAGLGIMLLLRHKSRKESSKILKKDVVFRVIIKLIIPFIMLFAFYVHFHGDYSPGGGFQAGVMLAGAVILYSIIFGAHEAQRVVPQSVAAFMIPLGVLIYAATGAISFIYGQNYMDYTALASYPKDAHHLGIILIELGVLITVASTMLSIFYAFVERRH